MENLAKFDPQTLMSFLNLDDLQNDVEPSLQFLNKKNTIVHESLINPNTDKSKNDKLLSKISYKLNNVGQRSEDFNKLNNDKTNILFAGCSVTFGHYLPENYTWPHHVYNNLKSLDIDLGPLNIVSFPGASGPKIVYNIFKYFNNYGIPDYLLILMPDMFRHYGPEKDAKSFYPSVPYRDGDKVTESLNPFSRIYEFQQFYRMLEIVCNLLNVKLYCTSWSNSANNIMVDFNFKTYERIHYNDKSIVDSLDPSYLKLYDKDFYITAADGMHPGFFPQYTYAQYFIEKVKNDIKN